MNHRRSNALIASAEGLSGRRWESLDALLAGAQRLGHDTDALLREVQIERSAQDKGVTIDNPKYVALIRLLTERLQDDALGLFSKPFRPGSVVLILRSALGATTLEQALRRIARAFALLQDDYLPSVTRSERGVCLKLALTVPVQQRLAYADVIAMRCFWRMTAWLSGGQITVDRFELPFAQAIDPIFSQVEYGGKIAYGCEGVAIWFSLASMQLPVRRDEASFKDFFSDAQSYLFGSPGLLALGMQLREVLLRTQPAWPDLPQAAALMNMSGSTLQRRLSVEGSSFQEVKDNLRRDLAAAKLQSGNTPIKALASELGFQDAPSFQRAFKAWTGLPPGQFRAAAQR